LRLNDEIDESVGALRIGERSGEDNEEVVDYGEEKEPMENVVD